MTRPATLLFYCRAGFEGEVAQEVSAVAAEAGVEGFVKAKPDSGYAAYQAHDAAQAGNLAQHLHFHEMIFPRQMLREAVFLQDLPAGDRIAPIVAAASVLGTKFNGLLVEMPDTNDGKSLSSLTRPLLPHLEKAFAKVGMEFNVARSPDRLHVFFVGGAACYVGVSSIANSSPHPMGIPRIRMPRGAPSRSTLKLAEALQEMVGPAELEKRMQPGMVAVDLGASPGGWSWQLVQRSLKVFAIDNGPMDPAIMETGQVKQRREDGFRYVPADPVDWMVCDMVEQPSRVAGLAAKWLREGWCRQAIFNLKLPMKKRREEVLRCEAIIAEGVGEVECTLGIRHLYHDREEVTAYLAVTAPRRS